jgi:hypothetical protein
MNHLPDMEIHPDFVHASTLYATWPMSGVILERVCRAVQKDLDNTVQVRDSLLSVTGHEPSRL